MFDTKLGTRFELQKDWKVVFFEYMWIDPEFGYVSEFSVSQNIPIKGFM